MKTSETRWIDNFQYLAIYINRKIAQWHSKFAKVGPKNSKHYVHKLSKICQKFKIFSKWRKFAKSGHNEWDPNRHSLNVRSTHCLNPSTHPHTASVRAASQDTTFSKVIYLHLLWWTSLNVSLSLFLYLFPSLFLSFFLSLSLSLCPVQSWIEIFCFSTWLWIFLFDVNHSIYLNCPTWRHGQDVTRLAFLFLSQFSQTKLDLIYIISTVWPNNGDDCSKWNLNCIINVKIVGRYLIQATT